MTVLYIHQYFRTPQEPGGTRSYWIAKKLIDSGHKVFMLTSKKFDENTKKHTEIDGINVIYLNVDYNQKMSFFKRIFSFLLFSFSSLREAVKLSSKIDFVYATSTPLTVGFPALFLYYIYNKRYIFEVRDLWPEVPIQLKIIKNKTFIYFIKKIEKLIYQKATEIIALSPGMFEGVYKVTGNKSNISLVPNMSKKNEFYPREKEINLLTKYNIDLNCLNFIYFGSIGYANGLDKLIEFFGQVNDNFKLYIAGSGSEENNLKGLVKLKNITNVSFLGNFNTSGISEIVNCCDVSIVSFLDIPILSTNSPNKFFDSLSAGKPILVNSDGWTRELVENKNCGFYYKYDDIEDFKRVLDNLLTNKPILENMSKNSLALSYNTYDKEILTTKIVEIINNKFS